MSLEFYKILHLTGIAMVFLSLGGVTMNALGGGSADHPWRKSAAMTHGIGLVLAFVAGFGLIAKSGVAWPWPVWIWLKLALWLVLGGIIAVAGKREDLGAKIWWGLIALFALAAVLAFTKPF